MNNPKIIMAMNLRLEGAISFEQFSQVALEAGVDHLSHVHHANTCTFHSSEDYFVFDLPYVGNPAVSPCFDVAALNQAIKAVDAAQISPEQFYIQKALAGVSVTHLFLRKNRIIYVGLSGDLHIEEW